MSQLRKILTIYVTDPASLLKPLNNYVNVDLFFNMDTEAGVLNSFMVVYNYLTRSSTVFTVEYKFRHPVTHTDVTPDTLIVAPSAIIQPNLFLLESTLHKRSYTVGVSILEVKRLEYFYKKFINDIYPESIISATSQICKYLQLGGFALPVSLLIGVLKQDNNINLAISVCEKLTLKIVDECNKFTKSKYSFEICDDLNKLFSCILLVSDNRHISKAREIGLEFYSSSNDITPLIPICNDRVKQMVASLIADLRLKVGIRDCANSVWVLSQGRVPRMPFVVESSGNRLVPLYNLSLQCR